MGVTTRLIDPDRSFPSTLAERHVEPALAGPFRRRPRLPSRRLLDLHPCSVRVLEVPACPICRAPSPTRRKGQIHHGFYDDGAKIVLDQRPSESSVCGVTLHRRYCATRLDGNIFHFEMVCQLRRRLNAERLSVPAYAPPS